MFEVTETEEICQVNMVHGKVNAMDIEFCHHLLELLDDLEQSSVRAIVLTGNDRVFSAGIDLKRWLAEDDSYVKPFLMALEQVFERIFLFPKPIVAAITGHAIAGGCMVAAACDYRIISPTAKIGIPELRVGVPLPMTAIEIMRFVANTNTFQSVVNLGALFEGQEAVVCGLANETVEPTKIKESSHRIAADLANLPAVAFQITKKQCRQPIIRIIEENKAELFEEYLQIWTAPETRASVQAYVSERL